MDSGEIHTRSDSEWEGDALEDEPDEATQFSQASVANMQAPMAPRGRNKRAPKKKSDVKWIKNGDFEPDPSECIRQNVAINPAHCFSKESTPLQILDTILTDEIVGNIVAESNRFVEQVQAIKPRAFQKWKPLSSNEFKSFWGLNLLMGIVEKPSVKDYWSTNQYLSTPIFGKAMSRNRFEDILRSLHFVNNENVDPTNKDRFNKLGSLLPDLISKFSGLIDPGEFICIDESLMPFSGRLAFQQYNPLKRARFGIKTMALVDCESKIMLNMLPYQGKTTALTSNDVELGFGGRVAITLLEGHTEKGHRLVVDNWYMSPKLAHHLLEKKTYVLGTVRKSRKNMPQISKEDSKLRKGETQTYSDGKLLVERWMDRREVFILNSFMVHEMVPTAAANPKNTRDKPQTVLMYNAKMGAVDDVDKQIRPYEAMRKTIKWYKKYAFYLLDLCVYNTYRMYLILDPARKKPRYKPFVLDLIDKLIDIGSDSDVQLQPTTNAKCHLPICTRSVSGRKSYSNCWYCFNKLNKRKQTCFKCTGCEKRLCIDSEKSCFMLAHENKQKNNAVQGNEDTEAEGSLDDPDQMEVDSIIQDAEQHEEPESNESISLLHDIEFV